MRHTLIILRSPVSFEVSKGKLASHLATYPWPFHLSDKGWKDISQIAGHDSPEIMIDSVMLCPLPPNTRVLSGERMLKQTCEVFTVEARQCLYWHFAFLMHPKCRAMLPALP